MDALECAYHTNRNGAGFMWVEDGAVKVWKDPNAKFDAVQAQYEKLLGRNFAIHLRFSTHGKIDTENTHPMRVLRAADHGIDLFMMHNGVMSDVPIKAKDRSDTWHFVQNFLKPMLMAQPKLIYKPSFQEMLGKYIGGGNKLLFLDNHGRVVIINPKSGSQHESGCWISNTYSINGAKLYRARKLPNHVASRYQDNRTSTGSNVSTSRGYVDPTAFVYHPNTNGLYFPPTQYASSEYTKEFYRRYVYDNAKGGYVPRAVGVAKQQEGSNVCSIDQHNARSMERSATRVTSNSKDIKEVVGQLVVNSVVCDPIRLTINQYRFLRWFRDKNIHLKESLPGVDMLLLGQCVGNKTLDLKHVDGRGYYYLTEKGIKSMMRTAQEFIAEKKLELLRPDGWENRPPRAVDPDDLNNLPLDQHPGLGETPPWDDPDVRPDAKTIAEQGTLVLPTRNDVAVYGQGQAWKEAESDEQTDGFPNIKSARELAKKMVARVLDIQSKYIMDTRMNQRNVKKTARKRTIALVNQTGDDREFGLKDVLRSSENDLVNLIMNYPEQAQVFMHDLIYFPEVFEEDLKCL